MKNVRVVMRTIFLSMIVFLLMGGDVSADMGPKPSITVKVNNAPDDYYIALLAGGDETDNAEDARKSLHVDIYDTENIVKYLKEFSEDGWSYFESPVGDNVYHSKDEDGYHVNVTGKDTYEFYYMVPRIFKIILITSDGEVHLSNAVTSGEFNAFVTYDYSTGILEIHEFGKKFLRFIKSLVRLVLTLLIEYSIFKSYGYAEINLNIFNFIVINIATQIFMYLNVYRYHSGGWPWMVLLFFCEAVVFVAEAIYLGLFLRDPDGSFNFKKNIECSLTANFASCIGGAAIAFVFYFVAGLFKETIIYNYFI